VLAMAKCVILHCACSSVTLCCWRSQPTSLDRCSSTDFYSCYVLTPRQRN